MESKNKRFVKRKARGHICLLHGGAFLWFCTCPDNTDFRNITHTGSLMHCIRTAWVFNSPHLNPLILISACKGKNPERSGKDSSPCKSQSCSDQLHHLPEVSAAACQQPLSCEHSTQGCFTQKSPREETLGSPSAFYWFQWEADPCPSFCTPRGDPAGAGDALQGRGWEQAPAHPATELPQAGGPHMSVVPPQDMAAPAGVKRDKADTHIRNWKWKASSFAQAYEPTGFSVDSGGFHCRDV